MPGKAGAKQATDRAIAARWWEWLDQQRRRARMGHSVLSCRIGADQTYIQNLRKAHGLPSYSKVLQIAVALGASALEALLMAGYAPQMPAEDWQQLLDARDVATLEPELAREVYALRELTPAQQRQVAAWLQGVCAARCA